MELFDHGDQGALLSRRKSDGAGGCWAQAADSFTNRGSDTPRTQAVLRWEAANSLVSFPSLLGLICVVILAVPKLRPRVFASTTGPEFSICPRRLSQGF